MSGRPRTFQLSCLVVILGLIGGPAYGGFELQGACHAAALPPALGGVAWEALDASEAIDLCEKSLAQDGDDFRTMAAYARALRKAERYEDAVGAARQAADAGDMIGLWMLANLYESGEGVDVDLARAFALYKQSAELGFVVAQNNLGVAYEKGVGVELNLPEAVKWYRLAAEQGDAQAQTNLGLLYAKGAGVDEDDVEAVKWFRLAADQGSAAGQNALGGMYDEGTGVAVDDEEAVKWYRLAAEQGYASAQNNLGWMYDEGTGVGEDDEAAVKWFRLAAEQGQADGQFNLGFRYSQGIGVDQSSADALKWFRLAAEQGDAVAQFNLGLSYDFGLGVEPDAEEAVKWYRLSAEQGIADSQVNLGHAYSVGSGVNEDDVEAVRWLLLAAAQGSPLAYSNLGHHYARGEGVEQSYEEAMRWYRLAADLGHASAQYSIGRMFESGEGVPLDVEEAIRWYHLAAAQNDALGQNAIGLMYQQGTGVARDYDEAVRWYRLSSDQGNAWGQVRLGLMYYDGKGLPNDDEEAVRLFRAAAEQDDTDGQYYLGKAYGAGRGVERDYTLATYWLKRSFDGGRWESSEDFGFYEASKSLEAGSPTSLATLPIWSDGSFDVLNLQLLLSMQLYSVVQQQAQQLLDSNVVVNEDAVEELDRILEVNFGSVLRHSARPMLRTLTRLGGKVSPFALASSISCDPSTDPKDGEFTASLQLAARRGHVEAALRLNMLGIPVGVTSKGFADFVDAQGWTAPWTAATLGWAYLNGRGTDRAISTALYWLREGAEGRSPSALRQLGEFHLEAGEHHNRVEGELYLRLAVIEGDPVAGELIAKHFGDDQEDVPSAALVAHVGAAIMDLEADLAASPALDTGRLAYLADHYLILGDDDKALQTKIQEAAIDDANSVRSYGSSSNYFSLLGRSCYWGSLSEWTYAKGREAEALYFAKVSVNLLQEARRYLAELPVELRECFLSVHEERYRWLADLFVTQGRLVEAENVLRMLEDFEYTEYLNDGSTTRDAPHKQLPLTREERELEATISGFTESLTSLQSRFAELDVRVRSLSVTEVEEHRALRAELVAWSSTFSEEVGRLLEDWTVACSQGEEMCAAETSAPLEPAYYVSVSSELAELRAAGNPTASLFTFVLPDVTTLLLVTDKVRFPVRWNIEAEEMTRLVRDLRQAIEAGEDHLPLAQRLYRELISPFEAELAAAGIDTLQVSLDRALGYLPLAVLHDGDRYLVEKYFLAVRTPAILRPREGTLEVAAFGVSQAHAGFSALPYVASELNAIVREDDSDPGIVPGVKRLDAQFTRDALREAIVFRYPIIHIATHFDVGTGDVSGSSLLLGDGSVVSVEDLQQDLVSPTDEGRVDLLVLSACSTGVPLQSYESTVLRSAARTLSGWSGVDTVVGTLWPVSDPSTAILMKRFYEVLNSSPELTRAAALAAVQREFIVGTLTSSSIDDEARGSFGSHPAAGGPINWSQPRYWGPFILIGNWL